jgi:protein kinase-like protein/AAA ATPase-like protein
MISPHMVATEPSFEVVRPLGRGATATVELVRLREPFAGLPVGAELALKTLAAEGASERTARAAFQAEVAAAAEVRAPSLVRVLHHGERAGRPYLLLQFVPGRTLHEVLEHDGPLPEPRLRSLGVDLAHALAALHARGLVHGDVKPENVRLDEEGRGVLLDLGFARRARGEAPAEARRDAGSLAYLAPERVRGEESGPAADVFALGIVLYQLAAGLHPFGQRHSKARLLGRASTSGAILRRSIELAGADELLAALDAARYTPPSRFAPSLSPFLDNLLAEVLARAPHERPRAEELAARLTQGERGEWWSARSESGSREGGAHEPGEAHAWPLVGRERELEVLRSTWTALARESTPRAAVVWLVGPEGSGKWRLLTSFAERLRLGDAPPLLLDARWNESDEGRPAGAVLMLLNRWLGLPAGQAPREREARRLSELVGPAAARPLLLALDPKQSGSVDRSVPAELARWLAKLGEGRTVLVFLDDLHQAGPVTLGALSSVLELLRGARLLFALSLREDSPAAEPAQLARLRERLERGAAENGPTFARLELAALDHAAVVELVERLFHDSVPRGRLAEALWQKSSGNPGFLTEILRELEARGGAVPASLEDPRYLLTIAPEALPTPRSLDKLIQERLGALEPDERTWLERLSVVGGRITPEFLMLAFPPTKRGEIDDILAHLVRKGWLVPAADRYRFERPALREALYRSLSEPRRQRLHASAARGLSADLEDLEEAYQRTFHLQAAGEHAELLAGVHAVLPALRRRASAQRLLTLARWALEALERLPGLEGRETLRLEFLEDAADAADRLGRREDQRVLLDHLANFELDPEAHPAEAARLYLLHARYAAGTGQFGLARGWLKSATTFAERSKDSWLFSQALRRMAQVQAQIGEFREARSLARKSLKRAKGENQLALAHLALAHVDVLEDELEDALAEVEAAFAVLRRTKEPRAGVLAYAELLRGRIWRSAGLPKRSMEAIQRAVLLARRAGERRLEAEALARRGGLLLDLDQPAQARSELGDALLLSDEIEDRRGQVLSMLWLGLLESEEGEARALASLERAVELAREIAFYRAEALGLALLARLRHFRGDVPGADRDSGQALLLVERHGAELTDRIVIVGTRALLLEAHGHASAATRVRAQLDKRIKAGQRRLSAPDLRAAQKVYTERLLRSVLSPEGPILPRRA